ncbi:MAG: AMP-binding protein [Pseudomonadota bacterium]
MSAHERWPDRPVLNVLPETALAYAIPAGDITYAAAMHRVHDLAGRLQRAGIGEGMRVALLLENRPDYFLIWLALNRLRASVAPINPDLRASELEYLIGHAEPALIIAVPGRIEALRDAVETSGIAADVVTVDGPFPPPRKNAVTAHLSESGDAREAAVLYTSGTTGNPKGCVLDNSYFTEVAQFYAGLGGIADLTEAGERMITPLPIFHMNAMAYSFMAMLRVGGCLTALDRFHPRTWWQSVRDSGATCLHYLGVMPSILMELPQSENDRTHKVRFGFGAGVDPKLHAAFENRFGFPLSEGWAMTETGAGAVIANNQPDRLVGKAALGRLPDWLEIRLVDENGRDVPDGEPGELLVRRKGSDPRRGFFREYYKDPEATETAWANGWFHTGDVVRREKNGFLFFVDRRKNVIRRSGENIAAVEVESVLMRHPDVTAAGVAPVPDPIRGDEVFACLTVSDPTPETAEQITRWALGQMAYYKVPGYIAFVDSLPLTSTQKIQRAELKALALHHLEKSSTINLVHLKKRRVS